jgi:transposase InsO family protein
MQYTQIQPFNGFQRHIIVLENLDELEIINIIQKYFSGDKINGVFCSEKILGAIQAIYKDSSTNMKSRYTQTLLEDITDVDQQNIIIQTEHKRAHRNWKENKSQILKKYYFPRMTALTKETAQTCNTCQIAKYTRHPDKPNLQEVPIPTYPSQIVQMDLFTIEKKWFITYIDCFTKYAMVEPIKNRSRIDIQTPFFNMITKLALPEIVVLDNEPSLKSPVIRSKLEEYGIKVYETPTGRSEVNGQIERLHSTILEIYRCMRSEKSSQTPSARLRLAVEKYNNSIHSVTHMTPHEALFGRKGNFGNTAENNCQRERDTQIILSKLKENQAKTREYHNKNRKNPKHYTEGEEVLMKNKQIISKHVNPKQVITVKKDQKVTILDSRGHKFHKTDIGKLKL